MRVFFTNHCGSYSVSGSEFGVVTPPSGVMVAGQSTQSDLISTGGDGTRRGSRYTAPSTGVNN